MSSPRKALADGDVSVVEKVRRFLLSPHSMITAEEHTSGWSSLINEPSDTQISVPREMDWYNQEPVPEYLKPAHQ